MHKKYTRFATTFLGLVLLSLTYSCGNTKDTIPPSVIPSITEDPKITSNNILTTPATKPTTNPASSDAEITPTAEPEALFPNPNLTYRTYDAPKGITFYFSEDNTRPQVLVAYAGQYTAFDWEYDLSLGEPLLSPTNFGADLLLPVKAADSSPFSFEATDYCVEYHRLDCHDGIVTEFHSSIHPSPTFTLADDFPADSDFTLTSQSNNAYYSYVYHNTKNIRPADEIVCEDVFHLTSTGLVYRSVQIQTADERITLGKEYHTPFATEGFFIPNDEFFAYCYTVPSFGSRFLNPDDSCDLDGDGTPEGISWRIDYDQNHRPYSPTITINGELMTWPAMEQNEDGSAYDYASNMYTPWIALLPQEDGTVWLALEETADGHSITYRYFTYENSELHAVKYDFITNGEGE